MNWLLVGLFLLAIPLQAQTDNPNEAAFPARPNPPRIVNDFVGILSAAERSQLEQKLVAYSDSTSSQIAIVIVKSTDPYPIGDFAYQLGRRWGVGQKGKNNGIVLAWSTGDRKVFIATGAGLSGAIPDAIAKRIINETIIPAFKQEQYYQGLDAATTEIIQRAKGEFKADAQPDTEEDNSWIFWVILGLIIMFVIASRNNRGGNNRNRGGGIGPVFFPTTFSGWGSSSGSGWGGGSSGGGFSGFGGGSFDGGGAGGSY